MRTILRKQSIIFIVSLTVLTGCTEQLDIGQEGERAANTIKKFFWVIEEGKEEELRRYIHDDFLWFTATGTIHTADELINELIQAYGEVDALVYEEIEDITLNLSEDGKTGWATFQTVSHFLVGMEHIQANQLNTMILKRGKDNWLIIHWHFSVPWG